MKHVFPRLVVLGLVTVLPGAKALAGVLYAAEVFGGARLETVDRATAQVTLVGSMGIDGPFGMSYNPDDGLMYAVDQAPWGRGLYTVDLSTGLSSRVGEPGLFGNILPRGLGYDQTNRVMYTSDLDTNWLFIVDLQSGSLTQRAWFPNFGSVRALTFDNTNHALWAIAGVVLGGGNDRYLVRIDPLTGVGTSVINLGSGPGSNFRGLAWDPEMSVLWTHNISDGYLTSLDPVTGVVARIGATDPDGLPLSVFNAIAFVPSPGTMAVLCMSGLVAARRRRPK